MTTKIEYAITVYEPHSLDAEAYSLYGIDRKRLSQTVLECLNANLSFRVAVLGIDYKKIEASELKDMHDIFKDRPIKVKSKNDLLLNIFKGYLVKVKSKKDLLLSCVAKDSPVLQYADLTLPVKSVRDFAEPVIFVTSLDGRYDMPLLLDDIEYVLKPIRKVK